MDIMENRFNVIKYDLNGIMKDLYKIFNLNHFPLLLFVINKNLLVVEFVS